VKVGMLTSWNTQCGIAEYSRGLVEALQAHPDVELVVLGSRNHDERAVAPDEDYVVACFDVERWNRRGLHELDVERILDLGLDVLHVQYQLALYDLPRLVELLERFSGATVITWHDNWLPEELQSQRFDVALTHRLGVGPAEEVITFGVRNMPAIVRTFGLGRSREEVIAPICERNGWIFESASTSETPFGGQHWRPWRELHDWLRGADAIVLWYADDGLMGSSQAAHTAIATRRPVVVTDTTWFADLQNVPGRLYKVADDPAALEATLRELLQTDPIIAEAAWESVAERHLDCYRRAMANAGRAASAPKELPGARPASSPAASAATSRPPAAPPTFERQIESDAGHLHRAYDLTAVAITSQRRLGGRQVIALKRATRRLLFPLLEVQSSLNGANARVTTFLLQRLAAQSRSVEELERELAQLRATPAQPPASVGPAPDEPARPGEH
jgi:hypothetical protein